MTGFIDAHIHLFDLKGTPRDMQPLGRLLGWNQRLLRAVATRVMPGDAVAFFGRDTDLLNDYLVEHHVADAEPAGFDRWVHVQAGWKAKTPLDPVGETAWLAGMDRPPAAIVAYADLRLGAGVRHVLEAHAEASPALRGIRHMLAWSTHDGVMHFAPGGLAERTDFRMGYDQLADAGLSYDAWCYSEQLPEVASLAAHNPDVPMALCHVGTPVGAFGEFARVGISEQERARILGTWREGIDTLAEHDHVHCKLSGLLMPVLGLGYERTRHRPTVAELVDRLGPIIDHTIDAFGPERCMVASNFPVDRVSVDYATLMAAMTEITDRRGEDAQARLFGGTAEEFYRI